MFGGNRCCSISIIISAIIIAFIANKLLKLGAFSTITAEQEHGNKNCEILTNKNKDLFGCEDIAQFEDGSIIFSCANRSILMAQQLTAKPMAQIMMETSNKHPGHLYLMDNINSEINSNDFSEIKLLNRQSPDFHPHGINVITDKSNTQWIYLINHRRNGDFVEIYQFDKDKRTAILQDSVHSPLFVMINDLKAVTLDSKRIGFYVTNSCGFPLKSKMNFLENVVGFEQNDLVFCEPDTREYKDRYDTDNVFKQPWNCRVMDGSLGFGNGIEMSGDGKSVYVVEMMPMRIRVYDRNSEDNTLRQRNLIAINSAGDNLYLDRETGDLYVGCHANMVQMIQHTTDSSKITPSQVLHWNAKTGEVTEIFLSNGHTGNHVSGSSVGIYDTKTKTLLIGTVNTGTMRCQL